MTHRLRYRVIAVVAAWYAIVGFAIAAILAGTWASHWLIAAGVSVGILGSIATVGLWLQSAWASKAVVGLGLSGAVFPIVGIASARNSTDDAFIAAAIGGALFLLICVLVARALGRASRPAI